MNTHKTKSTILKNVKVDLLIIPLVNWLNSFDSVFTKYSCEGTSSGTQKPYVVFSCDNIQELSEIVRRVGYSGKVYIRPPLEIRLMDFVVEFESKKELRYFIKVI